MQIETFKSFFKGKTKILIVLLLTLSIASVSFSGCATQNETVGTAVGAGTGFVLGALTGGPVGAILLTGVGAAVGFGIGYITGPYRIVREGGPYGMLNPPYRLASNDPVGGPAITNNYGVEFKNIKGVLISDLSISTSPKFISKGKAVDLVMKYNVYGNKYTIKDSSIQETRILEGLSGKIYYSNTSNTGIAEEGFYKTDLSVTVPEKIPSVYIYEAIVKVNNIITALSSKLVFVK